MNFPIIPCVYWDYNAWTERVHKPRTHFNAYVNPAEVQFIRLVTDKVGSYTEITMRSGASLATQLEPAAVVFMLDAGVSV